MAKQGLQKATTRSDIQLKTALGDYGTYIDGKINVIEGLIVQKDPESASRLEAIKLEIKNAIEDKNGVLYSMSDDLNKH